MQLYYKISTEVFSTISQFRVLDTYLVTSVSGLFHGVKLKEQSTVASTPLIIVKASITSPRTVSLWDVSQRPYIYIYKVFVSVSTGDAGRFNLAKSSSHTTHTHTHTHIHARTHTHARSPHARSHSHTHTLIHTQHCDCDHLSVGAVMPCQIACYV